MEPGADEASSGRLTDEEVRIRLYNLLAENANYHGGQLHPVDASYIAVRELGPNFLCRECMRLYDRDHIGVAQRTEQRVSNSRVGGSNPSPGATEKVDAESNSSAIPEQRAEAVCPPDVEVPVPEGVASGSKSDRLAVAQAAIEEGIRKEALSAKVRAARYRERKKLSDPGFMSREAARQKALRKRRKG